MVRTTETLRSGSDELTPVSIALADLSVLVRSEKRAVPESRCEEFLGMPAVIASPAMRRLISLTAKVGRTNHPVVITGESGTGKEIIARAIHHYSARASRPFIDVNCAALPEHLMESELFGYERGAFSGAESMKPGLFEAAHTGTLFLDEIGELDSRMQAKLLRVLDGQTYFRLGGSRKVGADVRVVVATNLNLEDAVRTGKFRRDLFHRLDSFHLHLPPLRERVEDIKPLAFWFLRESALHLSDEALAILEDYSWPGNIRELRNSLNKAVLSASGSEIEPRDLPLELLRGQNESADDEYSLNGLEQQTIHRVLAQTGGHQQKAADLLGISRRTLIRKLKLYRSPEHFAKQNGKHATGPRIVA
ncbi:MAG TPA: sigma-54 dependent transcriptional regulator [Bryobacteraceae bacterium]|jgi:transcriptional regulator with PAS, ATPase and Fis domain